MKDIKKEEIVDSTPKNNFKKVESINLGKLKNESKKSSIFVIFFMLLLIGLVLFLPNITEQISNLINKEKVSTPIVEKPKEQESPVVDEIKYYTFDLTTEITINNLLFNNLNKYYNNDYYLNIDIENKTKKLINFNNDNYYIELYSNEKMMLERIKVIGNSLDVNAKSTYKLPINITTYGKVSLIIVRQIKENNFPIVDITNNTLTCTNNGSTLTYTFDNDKLVGIEDKYSYTNEIDLNLYSETLMSYKEKQTNYAKRNGFTSTLVESGVSFIYNTKINLVEAVLTGINNPLFFAKNTSSKVVNFNLEAMRYDCK